MKIRQKKVVVAIGISMVGFLSVFAMPTAKEIEEIVPMVEDLMKADVEKMTQGVAKPSDVAEAALKLAQAADTPAALFFASPTEAGCARYEAAAFGLARVVEGTAQDAQVAAERGANLI